MRRIRCSPFACALLVLGLATAGCDSSTGGSGSGGGGTGGQGQGGAAGGGGDDGPATAAAATTTTVATVSVVSSTASTGSGEIVCPGGGYTNFPQSPECDMLQQNCEPGFTCERKRTGGMTVTTCVERGGLKPMAADCTVDDECEAGLFCAFDVCTPVCCSLNDEPCNGGNCNLDFAYTNGDTIRLCTYAKQCEPLTANACEGSTGCHFEDPTVATCIQSSGNDVDEGEACAALNDCDDMQQCSQLDGRCRWICALEDNGLEPGLGGCPEGQTCTVVSQIGLDGLGICNPSGG